MDKQYVIDARAALECWNFDISDFSDEEVVRLYHREEARRWKAVSVAARAAGKSISQLARSMKLFHQAMLKASLPLKHNRPA